MHVRPAAFFQSICFHALFGLQVVRCQIQRITEASASAHSELKESSECRNPERLLKSTLEYMLQLCALWVVLQFFSNRVEPIDVEPSFSGINYIPILEAVIILLSFRMKLPSSSTSEVLQLALVQCLIILPGGENGKSREQQKQKDAY